MKSHRLLFAFVGASLLAIAAGLWATSSRSAVGGPEPGTVSHFLLVVDGAEIATFREFEGLISGFDRAELELNAQAPQLVKLPGKRKPPTITLSRGLDQNMALWAWHQAVLTDVEARRDATLVIIDHQGLRVARFDLANAWPAKYELGALTAGQPSNALVETLTLTAEKIDYRPF